MTSTPATAWELRGPEEGPAVLLVPPLGRGRSSWAVQVPALEKSFRCVLFDPRGVGAARDAGTGTYTVGTLADDALGALDAAGIARAHVVGWSLGAAAATRLALDHPGRVASLSLLTPWARTDPHLGAALRMLRDLALHLPAQAAETATLWLILSRAAVNAAGDGLAEGARATVAEPGYPAPDVLAAYAASAADVDVLDRLRALALPVLVVGGTQDVLVPVAHAREVAAAVPGARLHVLDGDGASHALPLERSDEVNALLRAFLDEQPDPDGAIL